VVTGPARFTAPHLNFSSQVQVHFDLGIAHRHSGDWATGLEWRFTSSEVGLFARWIVIRRHQFDDFLLQIDARVHAGAGVNLPID